MGGKLYNRKRVSNEGHSVNDRGAHASSGSPTAVKFFTETYTAPASSGLTITVVPVESGWAPSGITIDTIGIKTIPASTYTVTFQKWTSPTDGAPGTIGAVSTSGTTEAENTSPAGADVAVGSIVRVALSTSTLTELTVWGEYTID